MIKPNPTEISPKKGEEITSIVPAVPSCPELPREKVGESKILGEGREIQEVVMSMQHPTEISPKISEEITPRVLKVPFCPELPGEEVGESEMRGEWGEIQEGPLILQHPTETSTKKSEEITSILPAVPSCSELPDLKTKGGLKRHFSMFRFEKIEVKKTVDKTEEDPARSKTYSDKLDSLTVVNTDEKVTVNKIGNHLTVEEYFINSNVDKTLNEEEKVKLLTSTKENQVRKMIRQFETRKLYKSPCTPTRKEKKGGKDSLKKQDTAKVPFTPTKITKQEGGKLCNSKSKTKRKASISKKWDTLAFPRGNQIKNQIESIEKSIRVGKLKQELVTNYFLKSSAGDKESCRGSLCIQSFGTEDGPERAVETSRKWQKTIQPIRTTDEIKTPSKLGQANQEERNRDCASNWMAGRGQVTRR